MPPGSNPRSIHECRLYGILDSGYCAPESMPSMAALMVAGGVEIIQLRAKHLTLAQIRDIALQIQPLLSEAHVPFVLNDHPQLAAEVKADFFHVGQDDLPLAHARQLAGIGIAAGKSTHSVAQATAAAREGADYIGFGPLFATPTKPDYSPIGTEEIAQVHQRVSIPIFCIGGVKRENLAQIVAAGARRVVVVSGILQAADVKSYCRDLRDLLHHRAYSG